MVPSGSTVPNQSPDVSNVGQLREQAAKCISERRYDEAVALFSRLAAVSGNEGEGRYGRGVAFFLKGSLPEAEGELQGALQVQPSNANALYYLGLCARQRNDLALAIHYIKRCIAADAQHAAANKLLVELEPIAENPRPSLGHGQGGIGGFYALLLRDSSEIARQARAKIDQLVMNRRARVSAFLGRILKPIFVALAICGAFGLVSILVQSLASPASKQQAIDQQIQALSQELPAVRAQAGTGSTPSSVSQGDITSLGSRIQTLQREEAQASGTQRSMIQGQIQAINKQIGLESQILALQGEMSTLSAGSLSSSHASSLFDTVYSRVIVFVPFLVLMAAAGMSSYEFLKARARAYSIAEGRVHITSGVLSRTTINIELYKVEDVLIQQSLINRLTGDAAIHLRVEVHGKPLIHKLIGIAKASEVPELLNQFRDLVFVLRSGPWGKGVIA